MSPMVQQIHAWSITGADGETIIGNTHLPPLDLDPKGVVFIAHGFKGYKDYGMFPRIAAECANAGLIAHRFNFSHSGMTNNIDTFERPDLFEKDTWNKQASDLQRVIETQVAVTQRDHGGTRLPYFLFGHSRGGVTAILTAGRFADDPTFPQPAGVITAAAPSMTCSLSHEDQQKLLRDGHLDSPSSRTGQNLRIGKAFLQEQHEDPANHDVLALAARIKCPMLIIHGESDPTVPVSAAHEIAHAAGSNARTHIVSACDHVFNTSNPLPKDQQPSKQLVSLIRAVVDFAGNVSG